MNYLYRCIILVYCGRRDLGLPEHRNHWISWKVWDQVPSKLRIQLHRIKHC